MIAWCLRLLWKPQQILQATKPPADLRGNGIVPSCLFPFGADTISEANFIMWRLCTMDLRPSLLQGHEV